MGASGKKGIIGKMYLSRSLEHPMQIKIDRGYLAGMVIYRRGLMIREGNAVIYAN